MRGIAMAILYGMDGIAHAMMVKHFTDTQRGVSALINTILLIATIIVIAGGW